MVELHRKRPRSLVSGSCDGGPVCVDFRRDCDRDLESAASRLGVTLHCFDEFFDLVGMVRTEKATRIANA
jgi:hypothetical protein